MRLAGLIAGLLLSVAHANDEQPNIVLFLVDDMGLMDTSVPFLVGKGGVPEAQPLNQFYRTPGMEALAANGFRCSRFYANSVCSPTRVSLMTGQSSARHKVSQWIAPWERNKGPHEAQGWRWEGVGRKEVTLPRLLQSAGYRTIHCGKGHFAPEKEDGANPQTLGFDVNIAGGAIGRPSSYYGRDHFGHALKGGASRAVPGLEAYRGKPIHLTEALTQEINREIGIAVEEKRPFFAYMSHYAVHSPFQADPRFEAHYAGSKGRTKKQIAYATMVEGIDRSLSDIVKHLEALGVAESTLILFLGDNGSDAPIGDPNGHGSSAPLRGMKGTRHEGGMRVPFIAAWGKPSATSELQKRFPIQMGRIQADAIASIHDIMPTLLEAASVTAPECHVIDGGSLWPMLAGHAASQPQKFLMHFPHKHRNSYFTVYEEGNWKLVLDYLQQGKGRHQLFDLKADPYENHKLNETMPEMLAHMRQQMKSELEKAGAHYPRSPDGAELLPD